MAVHSRRKNKANAGDRVVTAATDEKREDTENQEPHMVRVKTINNHVYIHRNVKHGFDGDDLVVISDKAQYMYPKDVIEQLKVY